MLMYLILGVCVGSFIVLEAAVTHPSAGTVEDVYYPSMNWSDVFDWKLLKAYAEEPKNVLLSPISLKIVLALLYEGSSGSTEREFQNVLQFTDKKSVNERYRDVLTSLQAGERTEYLLNIGTRVFLDSEIQPKQKFASVAKDFYKTDIELTNFTNTVLASESINSWIEKLTNGKITSLVKPDDLKEAILLITNAVFFKGTWRHQFPKNQTFAGRYFISHKTDSLAITTPFMVTKEKFYFVESTIFDAKIIRLPYKGGQYSMFIVLPNSKGGLPGLIKKISVANLKNLLYTMDLRMVQVTIPKFKFDFQARLVKPLRDLGLIQMFQNTSSFPGITRGNSALLRMLVVSDIIQKSGIEVDEEGSVVYAATDITVGNKIGETDDVFHADHPFLFYIEEESTGSILFIGKMENPLEEDPQPLPALKKN